MHGKLFSIWPKRPSFFCSWNSIFWNFFLYFGNSLMEIIHICSISLPRRHFSGKCRYRVYLYCVSLPRVCPGSGTRTFHCPMSTAPMLTCLLISSSNSMMSGWISSLVPPAYVNTTSWIYQDTSFLPRHFLAFLNSASTSLSHRRLPLPLIFTTLAIVVLP